MRSNLSWSEQGSLKKRRQFPRDMPLALLLSPSLSESVSLLKREVWGSPAQCSRRSERDGCLLWVSCVGV